MTRMTGAVVALTLVFAALGICSQASEEGAIKAVLEAQAEAWNQGDIAGFMEGYEDSPRTAYVGAKILKGYAAILASYRERYPGPAGMGEVAFTDLDVRLIDEGMAIVIGRFALTRDADAGGPASGIFTLVLRKGDEGWKIIHDHTS